MSNEGAYVGVGAKHAAPHASPRSGSHVVTIVEDHDAIRRRIVATIGDDRYVCETSGHDLGHWRFLDSDDTPRGHVPADIVIRLDAALREHREERVRAARRAR